MDYRCCVPVWKEMLMSPNMVFFFTFFSCHCLLFVLSLENIFFFLCKGEQGKYMLGVYIEILLYPRYSVFLPVLCLRVFLPLHFGCSSQHHSHSSHFLFKFPFKHLTEKVLIIFHFKV